MFRSRRTAALLGLASLAAACSDSDLPPLPEPQYEGERVRLATQPELRVCAGNLADFDRSVEAFEAALDIDPGGKSALYIVEDELYEGWCPEKSGGCARSYEGQRLAFTRLDRTDAIWHELAHDRAGRAGLGGTNRLFSEGLAKLQAGTYCAPEADAERPSIDALMSESWADYGVGYVYALASQFVFGLYASQGPAALEDFMRTGAREELPELRASYLQHFGSTIDDDYDALEWGAEGRHRYALGCRGEPPPSDEQARVFALEASLDCADPQVRSHLRPLSAEDSDEGYVEWVLEVEAPAVPNYDWSDKLHHELVGELPEGTRLLINRCDCEDVEPGDDEPWMPGDPIEPADPRTPRSFHPLLGEYLAPGLYRLRWQGPLDAGLSLDVDVVRDCNVAAQDCPGDEQCRVGGCEPGVPDPAEVGEPCTQLDGGPLVCVPGSYCLGEIGGGQVEGWCAQQCDLNEDCPAGEGCNAYGLCGPPCDWLAADCAPGYSCVPPISERPATCLPNGGLGQLEPCLYQSDCAPGLACAAVEGCNEGVFGGCCVPTCELAQPDCPAELPSCSESELYEPFGFGVCLE